MTITDLVEREHGTRNWVVARRTKRIVERYGDDVVCLSQKRFRALERESEYENATNHDALTPIMEAAHVSQRGAVSIVRQLLVRGWRIEKVRA